MGRGCRRSYAAGDDGAARRLEYADIFGVLFSGFPVVRGCPRSAPATLKLGSAGWAVLERADRLPRPGHFPRAATGSTCRPSGSRRCLPDGRTAWSSRGCLRYLEDADRRRRPTSRSKRRRRPPAGGRLQARRSPAAAPLPDKARLFLQLLGIVRDWLGDLEGALLSNASWRRHVLRPAVQQRPGRCPQVIAQRYLPASARSAAAGRCWPRLTSRHHGGRVVRHGAGRRIAGRRPWAKSPVTCCRTWIRGRPVRTG